MLQPSRPLADAFVVISDLLEEQPSFPVQISSMALQAPSRRDFSPRQTKLDRCTWSPSMQRLGELIDALRPSRHGDYRFNVVGELA